MSKKLDYTALLRKASISVVKCILQQIAEEGLFGKQHLYVTYALGHPDVKISKVLKDEFEDEITIVLQHEFCDLEVDDYGFSVSLAFEHADENLYVPFASLISISDPSEDFCIDFNPDFSETKFEESKKIFRETSKNSKIISLDAFRKR